MQGYLSFGDVEKELLRVQYQSFADAILRIDYSEGFLADQFCIPVKENRQRILTTLPDSSKYSFGL